ncbi:hypothetical protein GCM10023178_28040 [Actinomadura luteofluorescens]
MDVNPCAIVSWIGGVGLGDGEDAEADAERTKGVQMLARLRHPALVGGDGEQVRGRGRRDGEHVRDGPLVPRGVDERDAPARGQLRPGARLTGPPAREGAHERRLAVPTVTGGGDDVHQRPFRA